jgi:hypothetical protein
VKDFEQVYEFVLVVSEKRSVALKQFFIEKQTIGVKEKKSRIFFNC